MLNTSLKDFNNLLVMRRRAIVTAIAVEYAKGHPEMTIKRAFEILCREVIRRKTRSRELKRQLETLEKENQLAGIL